MQNRLKELRTSRGLSLRALANATGIDFSNIAHYERGKRNFSVHSQKVLADFFGVSLDYLLCHSEVNVCMSDDLSGKEAPYIRKTTNGYIEVYLPSSMNAKADGWVLQHRAVMAEALGRPLTDAEVVHHINGDKTDNRLSNLMLFATSVEHLRYHAKLRAEASIKKLIKE